MHKFQYVGRAAVILILLFFSYELVNEDVPWIFVDNANLMFHEAGHLIFGIFGESVGFLGGTIMQLLLPVIFMGYFLLRREWFASLVMVFWVANNLINVSVYMKDAIRMELPLIVEGTTHDWNWIFIRLNLLEKSGVIGQSVFVIGAGMLMISLVGLVCLVIYEFLVKKVELQ